MSLPENSRETHLIFIYGTLKKGFPNDHYMPTSAIFAGGACTVSPWPLVIDTEMGIPFLLRVRDHPNAKIVRGELYRVNEDDMQFLDHFEGLHTGFYIREQLHVLYPCLEISGSNQERITPSSAINPTTLVKAYAYFRSPSNEGPSWARKWTVERLLTLPMVEEYSQEHTRMFVARTNRQG